jgi:hypothetical protein
MRNREAYPHATSFLFGHRASSAHTSFPHTDETPHDLHKVSCVIITRGKELYKTELGVRCRWHVFVGIVSPGLLCLEPKGKN